MQKDVILIKEENDFESDDSETEDILNIHKRIKRERENSVVNDDDRGISVTIATTIAAIKQEEIETPKKFLRRNHKQGKSRKKFQSCKRLRKGPHRNAEREKEILQFLAKQYPQQQALRCENAGNSNDNPDLSTDDESNYQLTNEVKLKSLKLFFQQQRIRRRYMTYQSNTGEYHTPNLTLDVLLAMDNAFVPPAKVVNYSQGVKHDYKLEKAMHYDWPLFQQMWKEYCGIAGRVDNDAQSRIPKLHTLFVTELVKNHLFSRDYKQLSMAILPLTYLPKKTPEMFWKVGFELLRNSNSSHIGLSNFLNQMKLLMYHKQMPDVYLNQASLALQNQPDNTASILYHVSQDLTEVVSQESFQDDPCFNLFYGLVQYALWKDQYNIWNSQKQSQSQNISSMYSWDNDGEEEDNEFDGGGATSTTLSQDDTDNSNNMMSLYGKRAIRSLDVASTRMGTWDCILPKLVHLAAHYNEDGVAYDILRRHAENNLDNPVSYCYLIKWMNHTGTFEEKEIMEIYQKLADVDPTNILVKDLCVFYRKQGNYKRLVPLLLLRLDHVMCANSEFDWKMLLDIAEQCERNPDLSTLLDNMLERYPHWNNVRRFETSTRKITTKPVFNKNMAEVIRLKRQVGKALANVESSATHQQDIKKTIYYVTLSSKSSIRSENVLESVSSPDECFSSSSDDGEFPSILSHKGNSRVEKAGRRSGGYSVGRITEQPLTLSDQFEQNSLPVNSTPYSTRIKRRRMDSFIKSEDDYHTSNSDDSPRKKRQGLDGTLPLSQTNCISGGNDTLRDGNAKGDEYANKNLHSTPSCKTTTIKNKVWREKLSIVKYLSSSSASSSEAEEEESEERSKVRNNSDADSNISDDSYMQECKGGTKKITRPAKFAVDKEKQFKKKPNRRKIKLSSYKVLCSSSSPSLSSSDQEHEQKKFSVKKGSLTSKIQKSSSEEIDSPQKKRQRIDGTLLDDPTNRNDDANDSFKQNALTDVGLNEKFFCPSQQQTQRNKKMVIRNNLSLIKYLSSSSSEKEEEEENDDKVDTNNKTPSKQPASDVLTVAERKSRVCKRRNEQCVPEILTSTERNSPISNADQELYFVADDNGNFINEMIKGHKSCELQSSSFEEDSLQQKILLDVDACLPSCSSNNVKAYHRRSHQPSNHNIKISNKRSPSCIKHGSTSSSGLNQRLKKYDRPKNTRILKILSSSSDPDDLRISTVQADNQNCPSVNRTLQEDNMLNNNPKINQLKKTDKIIELSPLQQKRNFKKNTRRKIQLGKLISSSVSSGEEEGEKIGEDPHGNTSNENTTNWKNSDRKMCKKPTKWASRIAEGRQSNGSLPNLSCPFPTATKSNPLTRVSSAKNSMKQSLKKEIYNPPAIHKAPTITPTTLSDNTATMVESQVPSFSSSENASEIEAPNIFTELVGDVETPLVTPQRKKLPRKRKRTSTK